MPEEDELTQALTAGAQRLAEAAAGNQQEWQHAQCGLHHWLLALLERHAPMVEALAMGVSAAALRQQISDQLAKGQAGPPLGLPAVAQRAHEMAQARGKNQATEQDVARVLLQAAGYAVAPPNAAFAVLSGPRPPDPAGAVAPGTRVHKPTPTLEQFGRDLTREARDGRLSVVVGRDEETDLVIETLCRRTKRNPVLVGPAGVGKTAIVEGLAQRIARGEVPQPLRDVRVLALQPSTLVAGAGVVGELEKRMRAILAEASQDGVLLFIDEVHSVVGAGGMAGTGDVASLLKPALARGDLACIAATTDDEYRRFIEPDGALERRFQPVRVQELSPPQALAILKALAEELGRQRGVAVAEPVLGHLVDFAHQHLHNRYFPDKAVDLLEQCVAHALAHDRRAVEIGDANNVVQRMVGMPLALGDRLAALRGRLRERALLTDADAEALLKRLDVTLRGLDLRPARPNAVVLLVGDSASHAEPLAETVAECLFGAAERIVTLDFSRFTEHHHVSLLVGAPPGYVGYSDALPLHRVAQMPWCVVCAENVHACHPQVLEVFTQALASGFLTDSRGKRVYLSDAVVLLTADLRQAEHRPVGFRHVDGLAAADARDAIEKALGPALLAEVDVVCTGAVAAGGSRERWLAGQVLPELAARYRSQGVELSWDAGVVEWLLAQQAGDAGEREWERLVDDHLSPLLVSHLPEPGSTTRLALTVEQGSLRVQPG